MSEKLYMVKSSRNVYTETGYETRECVDGFFTSPSENSVGVDPVCLPGSPDSGRVIVVEATGCSFYMNENGECVENRYEVAPVIAKNLQSAFCSLFGRVKRELTLESCKIYEIGKDYSSDEPEDIFTAKLTGELFKKVSAANGKLDPESMSRDYIAELTEFDEQNPAFTTKLNSKELKSVADHLMKTAEENAAKDAKPGAKLVFDPGTYEILREKLAKTFTTRELKLLEAPDSAPDELKSKALALAPKAKAKVSFLAKLFGKN